MWCKMPEEIKPICDQCAMSHRQAGTVKYFTPVTGFTECGECGVGVDDDYILWYPGYWTEE